MKKIIKYQQIINDISNKIRDGIYIPNKKLPTEETLAKNYKVSRMTVNKALSILEKDNLIYKIQGSGTFVKQNKINKKFGSSISFSEDITKNGGVPKSELLEYKITIPSNYPEIAKKFNISNDYKIIYFRRLRYTNNDKLAISHTYISSKIIPKINIEELNNSFYKYLKNNYNIIPICKNYIVSAILPNDEQKQILEIENTALLKVAHYSYTQNEEIFEYNETYYLGDKFVYTTDNKTIEFDK